MLKFTTSFTLLCLSLSLHSQFIATSDQTTLIGCAKEQLEISGSYYSNDSASSNQYSDSPQFLHPITGIDGVISIDNYKVIDSDGFLWVWGSNISNNLGLGHKNFVLSPEKNPFLVGVQQIESSGGVATLVVAGENKELFFFGRDSYGITGDTNVYQAELPTRVTELANIKDLSIGYRHVLACIDDGSVWAWGANYNQALGNDSTPFVYTPRKVSNLQNIVKISAGLEHSLALDINGNVFAWGGNAFGQCGIPTNNALGDRMIPLDMPEEIIQIRAEGYFSIALGKSGKVYAFGSNAAGQLGNISAGNSTHIPTEVKNIGKAVSITSSTNHCFAQMEDGTILAWGANFGQLGVGHSDHPVREPEIVQSNCNLVNVENTKLIDFLIAPNPSNTGLFTLQNTNEILAWRVYNSFGQTISVGEGNYIDLQTHPTGIYTLHILSLNRENYVSRQILLKN